MENTTEHPSPLLRRFGLIPATALNMSNMIGVGRAGRRRSLGGWWRSSSSSPMAWSGPNWERPCRARAEATSTCAKDTGAIDGLSLHLAVHLERAAGDCVRLHRLRQIRQLYLARPQPPPDDAPGRRHRRAQHHPALSPHRGHRQDHRQPVDRNGSHDGCRHSHRHVAVRFSHRFRFSARCFRFLARLLARIGRRRPHRHLRLSRLLRCLLHWRGGQGGRGG